MLQERGHGKERKLEAQLLQKKLEEEKARKFKAIPYLHNRLSSGMCKVIYAEYMLVAGHLLTYSYISTC
jgi:hypothetical protein